MPNYAIIKTEQRLATVTYMGEGDAKLGMLTWNDGTYLTSTKAELTSISADVAKLDNVASVYYSSFDSEETGALGMTWFVVAQTLQYNPVMPIDPSTDIVDAMNALPAMMEAMGKPLPASGAAMLDKATAIFGPELRFALTGSTTGNLPYGNEYVIKIMDWLLFVQTGTEIGRAHV